MHSASYEITALIARYILIFLCGLVLIRTIFISRAMRPNMMKASELNLAKLSYLETDTVFYLGYDNIIGASKRCDVQISGRGVSKIHIQIYKKRDCWMMCTYSKKATYLNEIKISGKIQIESNDVIRIGSQKFKFNESESGEV